MATPRRQLVDRRVSGDYHCISRCVRRAFLCGGAAGGEHRKAWIRDALERLEGVFAIQVVSFALMDNHMHLLLRTQPRWVRDWSDEEVVRRWARMHQRSVFQRAEELRGMDLPSGSVPVSESGAADEGDADPADDDVALAPASGPGCPSESIHRPLSIDEAITIVATRGGRLVRSYRRQLSCLSKYHQVLKHAIAVRANREDGCRGHFWESRFSSLRVMDLEHLLATMIYVDLNPIRAGTADTPERSEHTSVLERIKRILRGCHTGSDSAAASAVTNDDGRADARSRTCASTGGRTSFLAPMNRSRHPDGIIEGLEEQQYVTLVDQIGRQIRADKRGSIPRHLPPIIERLLTLTGRLSDGVTGTVLGGTPGMRRREARRRGTSHVRGPSLGLGLHGWPWPAPI